jgi:hypothetical protein
LGKEGSGGVGRDDIDDASVVRLEGGKSLEGTKTIFLKFSLIFLSLRFSKF